MKVYKMKVKLPALAVLGTVGYAAYMGAFSKPKVDTGYYPGAHHFFYKEVQTSLRNTGQEFKKFMDQIEANPGIVPKDQPGKTLRYKPVRICYDDPKKLVNEKESRMVIGVEVEEHLGDNMVQTILAADTDLKLAELPLSESAKTKFPLVNTLSYILGPMKAYPAMEEYLGKDVQRDDGMTMERYERDAGQIEFYAGFDKSAHERLAALMPIEKPAYLK